MNPGPAMLVLPIKGEAGRFFMIAYWPASQESQLPARWEESCIVALTCPTAFGFFNSVPDALIFAHILIALLLRWQTGNSISFESNSMPKCMKCRGDDYHW